MYFGAGKLSIANTDPSYDVRPFANSNNFANEPTVFGTTEGKPFIVYTENVPEGVTLYWEIFGISGNVTAADFEPASLTGSFVTSFITFAPVWPDLNDGDLDPTKYNASIFFVYVKGDGLTEGLETFKIRIRTDSVNGPIVATCPTAQKITDNSQTAVPTYDPTPLTSSVNEGSTVTFRVYTENVTQNTTLYYTTTASSADVSPTSGSFQVSSTYGSGYYGDVTITALADTTTEGNETFQLQVRTGSTSGTIVGTSSAVTINDTSQGAAETFNDANAAYLKLALPFNSGRLNTDVSHLYPGSSSTQKTPIQLNGTFTLTTDNTKFYGSSSIWNGTRHIYYTGTGLTTAGNFTIEFWARTDSANYNNWVVGDGTGSTETAICLSTFTSTSSPSGTVRLISSGGTLQAYKAGDGAAGRIGGMTANTWYHFAFTKQYWFVNGVYKGTMTWASNHTWSAINIGGQDETYSGGFVGAIQDFKVYVGINKYGTGGFTPPGQIV